MLGDDAKVVYMVRDPIDRLLSHYLHNVAGGYERRSIEEALADAESAYVQRSLYARQAEPYIDHLGAERIAFVTREDLRHRREDTMRRMFGFLGVEEGFSSPQFEREWETGSAKGGGGFRLMDRAVRLPGLRSLDRNFDRLPERWRWMVERIVHDPGSGEAPKPELPADLRTRLAERFGPDVERLEELTGRKLDWLE